MKTTAIILYSLIATGYILVALNSKTIINSLKECIYLFFNTEWEEE